MPELGGLLPAARPPARVAGTECGGHLRTARPAALLGGSPRVRGRPVCSVSSSRSSGRSPVLVALPVFYFVTSEGLPDGRDGTPEGTGSRPLRC
ncbi:hypothetical protein LT493_00845 [Streptomyces tricolor]|nr:hypothetical protein [Streptomyces tricolor]